MNQKAGAATVTPTTRQAQLQADTDKALYDLGVISGLAYKRRRERPTNSPLGNDLENQRLTITQKAIRSQWRSSRPKSIRCARWPS